MRKNLYELVRKQVLLGLRMGNKSIGSVQETLEGEVSRLWLILLDLLIVSLKEMSPQR